jgi:hypothetical protein
MICNDVLPGGCLDDNGRGQKVTLGYGTFFDALEVGESGGNPEYLILHGSDCLNVSHGYVYDDSCPADSSEIWIHAPNGALRNLHAGLNMTADFTGADVVVAGGPANYTNEWGFL